jgi:hypothetical protein
MGMMRRVAVRYAAVSLLALFPCCTTSHDVNRGFERTDGDGNDGGDGDSVPDASVVAVGELCARFARTQCEGEQHCCDEPTRSRERCQTAMEQSCAQGVYLDQIEMSPKSDFDADTADRVFSELEKRTAECDPSITRWALSEEGLRSAFRGTLKAGEACNSTGGVLGDRGLIAAALAACRHADGLACLPQSLLGTWSCAPKQADGQSCVTDDNCQPASVCNNFGQAALGSCVARLPLGAACTNSSECESVYCDDNQCATADAQTVYCAAQ